MLRSLKVPLALLEELLVATSLLLNLLPQLPVLFHETVVFPSDGLYRVLDGHHFVVLCVHRLFVLQSQQLLVLVLLLHGQPHQIHLIFYRVCSLRVELVVLPDLMLELLLQPPVLVLLHLPLAAAELGLFSCCPLAEIQ